MPKLTDTQLVILSTAAQRDDGAVHPLPSDLEIRGGAVAATLNSLRKKGLIAAEPQNDGDVLVITAAGCQAVGIAPEETPGAASASSMTAPAAPLPRARKKPPAAPPRTRRSLAPSWRC